MRNFNLLKSVLVALCLLVNVPTFSKTFFQEDNPWTQKSIPSNIDNGSNTILGYYTLDFNKLKTILATSGQVKFPFRNGNLALFKITKTGSLSPDLQLKYPGIGTYSGAIDGLQKIDFTINTFGLIGKIKIDGKTYTLKPVGDSNYILTLLETATPLIDDDYQINQSNTYKIISKSSTTSRTANLIAPSTVPSLKTYRLAVAPTAEYSNYFIVLNAAENASLAVKKEIVMSAIAQTIATVNSITIVDMGIKFELVSRNDELIEFNTANDKLTHDNKMTLLGEVSSVINSKIGVNSYDLGHVFDASNFGGVANLYVLCQSNKANGVSGSGIPEGDYFSGVVAHEMGHQMGAVHTFNSNVGVGTNRVETGDGITIMGYGNRELFYHAKSIDEMNSYISSTSCASVQKNSNTAPAYLISPLSTLYTIPAGTPFVLGQNFSFTDTQNNTLSYNWDQMDAVATSNPPLKTSNVGPSFISIFPNEELVRYFPKLETVLSGTTASTWEVIPQVSRDLNFSLNVRETNSIAPILIQENFKVTTLNDGTGPFLVTSQGVTGLKYKQGDEVMVNWNESSSKSNAINTQNVKISLSYDAGLTFSHVLKESTPNDGAEKVLIPILANTSNARIKVEPVDNIYYAINMVNFEIINPPFVFNKNTPDPIRCFGEQNSSITVDPSGGGGAPYTISWFKKSNLNFDPITDADTDPKTLINKGVGIYKVRVTDKDAVQYEQEIEIIGPANPLLVSNITANTIPVMCYGDKTGQFSLQVSGGSAPYKYILNGVEVALNRGDANLDIDTYTISNLIAGSYSVKIVDANSCQSETITIVINGPSSALAVTNSAITNTTLTNSNGAISITIAGGTAPYNYSWTGPNNYTSTTQNIESLANGIYKLRVTDKNTCVLESNFTIEPKDVINYNITQTNVSCKGGNNGELGTYPSGGNGAPYSVIWRGPNSFSSTNFKINNLVSGDYELTIADQLGVSFPVKTVTITEPQNNLVLSGATLTNVSCVGDSSGSFGLNTTGGTSPYSYFLNGIFSKTSGISGTNSDVFTKENLAAGTYNINIKDNAGCLANHQVVLTEPLNRVELSSFVISPVSTRNASDGAISIEASGGFLSVPNGTYTYSWSGPNSYTSISKNISGLSPGTYTVVVTDSNLCVSTARAFILENPDPFIFNISTINTTCSGNTLGSITANPRGGYGAPYVVNWFKYNGTEYVVTNDGILDGNDLVLSKIGKGVYKIVITDSKGISYSQDNITIAEPAVMDLQLVAGSIHPETCFGLKNGAFSVSISGGSVPYDYVLNDTKILTNSSSSKEITGLEFGNYILTLKDLNGCLSNSLAVYVPGPEEIVITNLADAITPIKCHSNQDGAIAISVKGGSNTGYTFLWTGPSGFTSTSEDLSGLSLPGTYHLKITDAIYTSCSKEFDFVLIEPAQLQATVSSITNNVCYDFPYIGGYSVTITGGTLPYTVNGGLFNGSPVNFSEKPTGNYTVTVNDANSCSAISLPVTVSGPTSAIQIANKVAVNNHCDSSTSDPANATLSFDLSAGTPFTDLTTNKEYYKVSLTGIVTGAVPFRNFYIDTSTHIASVRFDNLKDDVYTVAIMQKDPNVVAQNDGCKKEFDYKISKTVYWLSQTVQNVSCASSDTTGKMEFKGIYGGTPFVDSTTGQKYYKYQIFKSDESPLTTVLYVNQGDDLGVNNLDNQKININGLPQGSYYIQFIDDNSNCEVPNKTTFKILIPKPHTLSWISKTESCFQESNGTATVKITGGAAPYQVSMIDTTTLLTKSISPWFGVFGEEYPLGATQVIDMLSAGTYKMHLKDSNGCESETLPNNSITIQEFNAFSHSLAKEDVTCFGAKNGKVTLTLNGGSQPLSVELFSDKNSYKVAEFLSDNGSGGVRLLDFDNLPPGNYTLTVKDINSQCIDYKEENIIISEPSEVIITALDIDIKNISCYDKTDGKIKISVTGGGYSNPATLSYNYVWKKNGNPITNPTDPRILTGLAEGVYTVSVTPVVGGVEKPLCAVEQTYSIIKPEQLYLIEEVNQHLDVYCNGNNTGVYKIYFSGGTAPYSVFSDGGRIASGIYNNEFTKTNLSAKTSYQIDIQDASGCKFSEGYKSGIVPQVAYGTLPITISQPDAKLSFKEIITPITCKEEASTNFGSIEINVSGGTPPYSITWSGPIGYREIGNNPQTGVFKIAGPVGSYNYTVIDAANNCGATPGGNPEIKEPTQLIITEQLKTNTTQFNKSDGHYKFILAGNVNDATFYDYVTTTKWYKIINNQEQEQTQYANGTFEALDLSVGSYVIRTTTTHKAISTTKEYSPSIPGGTRLPDTILSGIICSTYKNFEITQPALLTVREDISAHLEVKCHGAQTGVIKLNISGGTAPYEVRWTLNGATTGSKINQGDSVVLDQLSAGDYTIDVIDALNNHYSTTIDPNTTTAFGVLPVRITQPESSLQITTNIVHETCRESNDGTIEVIITGGTSPYSITWDQSPNPIVNYLSIDSNGTFKIKGEAGQYHYLINDKYNVCGTIPGPSIEIKQPELLEIQEQLKVNATEFRKPNGKYTFGLVGNTDSGPFVDANTASTRYAFNDYATHFETNWYKINSGSEDLLSYHTYSVSDLTAGLYRIKTTSSHKSIGTTIVYNGSSGLVTTTYFVSNSIECSTSKDFEITQPALLTVTEEASSHLDVKCHGAQTGVIKLNISGGTAPYEVRWTLNGATSSKTNQGNSVVLDQLSAGDYTIDVIDALSNRYSTTINPNNTTAFGILPISISEPGLDRKLFFNKLYTSLTDTSCGENNGTINLATQATVIDVPNTANALNYFWTGPNGITSNDRNLKNLVPGSYSLTITDQNACSISTDIAAPFIIKPSVGVHFDAPEFVILHCKTPIDPAVISLSNITGTEVNGQKIVWSKFNESSSLYEPIDNSTASDNRILTVTNAGRYKAIVSTLNPICSFERIINVYDRGFIFNDSSNNLIDEASVSKGEKPSCYNGKGSFFFKIKQVQANPSSTFEFYLDNTLVNLESDSLIHYEEGYKLINLAIGMHSLKVKDEFSCEAIINFEIENRQEIRLTSSIVSEYIVQNIQCFDEFGIDPKNKARISVDGKVVGGTGLYKYRWDGPSSFSSANATIEVTKPGIYNLVIIDANKCESQSYPFTISAPQAISITEIFHKNQSCTNETGSVGISIAGGTAPYSIVWKNANNEILSTNFEINNLPLGVFTANVTDANGCTFSKEITIINERLLLPSDPVPDEAVCLGKPGFILVKVTKNNDSTLQFFYNNLEVKSIRDTQELFRVIIDAPIFGADLKILNSFGCSKSYTYKFGIAVPKLEIVNSANKILGLTDRISENEIVLFKNNSEGTYSRESLDFGDGSDIVNIDRGDLDLVKRKHSYSTSGVYTSKMEIFNEEGCSVIEKRLIFVGKSYMLKFPNSFSPNLRKDGVPEGDNLNDYFRPIFNGFKSGKMAIYDASGVMLYEESFSNPDFKDTVDLNSWKGWNGKNASTENKIYFCFFEGVTFENLTITESTNFYLFK